MKSRLLALAFATIAVVLGVFLVFAVPLGQVADETAHAIRADALRHFILIGHREADQDHVVRAGIDADPALRGVVTSTIKPTDPTPVHANANRVRIAEQTGWSLHPTFQVLGTIAGYMPIFYLPGAVGLAAADRAGVGPHMSYRVARLVDLFCFVVMGTTALLLARQGQTMLFCALTLPTTLNLAASLNQDGLLIAAAVLAAALVTSRPAPASLRHGLAAALIGCVIVVKPPYLPLALILLLPVAGARSVVAIAVIGLCTAAWAWLIVHRVAVPEMLAAYHPGPLYPGSPQTLFTGTNLSAQLRVLEAHPAELFLLPWQTMRHGAGLFRDAIATLGWSNVALPPIATPLWLAALAGAGIADAQATGRGRDVLLLALALLLTIQAICLSQYLAWTPVGAPWIGGVQGRYLLPLVPMLGLIAARVALPGARLRQMFCVLAVIAAASGLATIPHVIGAFYLPG